MGGRSIRWQELPPLCRTPTRMCSAPPVGSPGAISRPLREERFQLQQHVWHRGLNNNRTQILAAIMGYQLVLHMNQVHCNSPASITWVIDAL